MMVLVNPPDLLIEIPVWRNYNQVHKIFFSKDLDFISFFFNNQQSKLSNRNWVLHFWGYSKVYGPRVLIWRVKTAESGRSCIILDGQRLKVDGQIVTTGPKG